MALEKDYPAQEDCAQQANYKYAFSYSTVTFDRKSQKDPGTEAIVSFTQSLIPFFTKLNMYTFTEASDIAIVGGGIAGVCLTLGLLKQNVNVTVYEGARSFHEIGGGISVGPNARRALQLLGPEVYEAVQGLFTNNLDPKEQDTFFSWRVGAPPPGSNCKDAQLVTKLKCLQGQSAVHRAHFLDELVKLLPKGVARFGKKLTQVEELDEKKGFRLVFRDGTEALHQHVIGCDGIKSVIRKHILGEESPAVHAHFAKKYVHRGVIPTEKAIAAVGEDLATNAQIYMGKNGYVNTLPINQGRSMNGKRSTMVPSPTRLTNISNSRIIPLGTILEPQRRRHPGLRLRAQHQRRLRPFRSDRQTPHPTHGENRRLVPFRHRRPPRAYVC